MEMRYNININERLSSEIQYRFLHLFMKFLRNSLYFTIPNSHYMTLCRKGDALFIIENPLNIIILFFTQDFVFFTIHHCPCLGKENST